MKTKIVHSVIGLSKEQDESRNQPNKALDYGLTQTYSKSTYRRFENGQAKDTSKKDSDDVALVGYKDGLPFTIMADGYYEHGYDGPNKAPIIHSFLENEVLPLLDLFIKDCQDSDDPDSVIKEFIKTIEKKYADKFLSVQGQDWQVVAFTLSMCVTYRKGDEIRCSGFNIGDQSIVLKKNSGEIKQLGYVTMQRDRVGGQGQKDGFDREMLQDLTPMNEESDTDKNRRNSSYTKKRDAVHSRADIFTEVVEAGDLLLSATSLLSPLQRETNEELPQEPIVDTDPTVPPQFRRSKLFVSKSEFSIEQFGQENPLDFSSFVQANVEGAREYISTGESLDCIGDDFLAVQMVIPTSEQCEAILESSSAKTQISAWRAAGTAIGVVVLLFVGLALAMFFSGGFAAVLRVMSPTLLAVTAFLCVACSGLGAAIGAQYKFRDSGSVDNIAPDKDANESVALTRDPAGVDLSAGVGGAAPVPQPNTSTARISQGLGSTNTAGSKREVGSASRRDSSIDLSSTSELGSHETVEDAIVQRANNVVPGAAGAQDNQGSAGAKPDEFGDSPNRSPSR